MLSAHSTSSCNTFLFFFSMRMTANFLAGIRSNATDCHFIVAARQTTGLASPSRQYRLSSTRSCPPRCSKTGAGVCAALQEGGRRAPPVLPLSRERNPTAPGSGRPFALAGAGAQERSAAKVDMTARRKAAPDIGRRRLRRLWRLAGPEGFGRCRAGTAGRCRFGHTRI